MVTMCLPRLWACLVWALRAQTQLAQTWRPDLGDALRASPKPALAIGAAPLHRGPRRKEEEKNQNLETPPPSREEKEKKYFSSHI